MTILNRKGKSLNISASAIETFLDCRRKWWYGYVERIRGPKSPAAERGDKIHDLAERILKGEADPDNLEGEDKKWFRYLEPGLQFAPSPEEVAAGQWGVEDWVKEPCGPLTFVGKVDIYERLAADPVDPPAIADWKTTGNKEWKWSKTPSQLSKFLQPHVYAYGLYKNNPPEEVSFQHINLQSRGVPDAMEVWGSATWEEILDTWDRVVKYAEDMADVVNTCRDAEDVEPSIGACRKFGGCEYADMCPASPKNYQPPKPTKKLDLSGVQVSQNNDAAARAAALRAKLGIGKTTSTPTITPPPKAPVAAGPTPTGLVRNLLDNMGKVPARVAEQLAGAALGDVISELGLVLSSDGFYFYGEPEPEPEAPTQAPTQAPAPDWSIGEKQRDFEVRTGQTCPASAKVVAGYLVPEDWDKDAIETSREFGDEEVKAAADALASVPAPDPTPTPAPPETKEKYDVDTRKAARILVVALQERDTLDKGDARDLVVAETTWRRITDKRWAQVIEAANGTYGTDITFDNDTFATTDRGRAVIEATVEKASSSRFAPPPTPHPVTTAESLVQEGKDRMAALKEAHAAEVQAAYERGYKECAEVQAVTIQDAEATGYRRGRAERASEVTPAPGPTVYVNCRPTRGDVEDFAAWIAPFEDQVAEDQRVPYYGLADFGKGPKMVASLVKAHLHVEGPGGLPTALFIDTFHPCCSDVLQILKRLPGVRLVVGVRA